MKSRRKTPVLRCYVTKPGDKPAYCTVLLHSILAPLRLTQSESVLFMAHAAADPEAMNFTIVTQTVKKKGSL